MNNESTPFIPASQSVPEITLRVVVLSFFLTIILAASNCFLALKIGYLTSASIPAAILSIGILRFFKNANVLENNLVQTCASAGEAIAGGIAYTAPALIIIHYWLNFDYLKTFLLALASGVLGVLFSTPLRRFLVTEKNLTFPEGRAIAEVLKAGTKKSLGLKELLLGASGGALLELAQTGFQLIGNSIQYWFFVGSNLFGFGIGFSATMVGAGYLMGFQIAVSLLVGAILGWGIGIPLLTHIYPIAHNNIDATQLAINLWQEKIRYVGIGAMLFGGVWTLVSLFRPLWNSLKIAFENFSPHHFFANSNKLLRTEKDLPTPYILIGVLSMLMLLFWVFAHTLNLNLLGISQHWHTPFLLLCLIYLAVVSFIFSAICGYFSGLVGVTATPGSAIVIAGLLLTALLLTTIQTVDLAKSSAYLAEVAAMIILAGCVITGTAAISNDNIQDLKTGHLLGATPWKQQMMLLFGTIIAAAVIPFVMQVLLNVYGIGDVLPRPGMDPTHTLSAPTSMMMATIALHHSFPWQYMLIGVLIIGVFIMINRYFIPKGYELSLLGIATGIYLPLTTITPLFFGGFFALLTRRWLAKHQRPILDKNYHQAPNWQKTILLACGLVSGAAVMDVILAIPFALAQNLDVLRLIPKNFPLWIQNLLGVVSLVGLGFWFYSTVSQKKQDAIYDD